LPWCGPWLAWMVRAAGWPGMGSSLPSGACQSHSFSDDDEFSLPLLLRGIHASFDGSSETPPKKYAPGREQASGCSHCVGLYITFSAKIKVLSRYSSVSRAQRRAEYSAMVKETT